jgi:hypothetical protein
MLADPTRYFPGIYQVKTADIPVSTSVDVSAKPHAFKREALLLIHQGMPLDGKERRADLSVNAIMDVGCPNQIHFEPKYPP